MRKSVFLLFSALFISFSLPAQEILISQSYPATDFRSPLDINLSLSSAFGEIRSNHLHSGLDIRTNQREGYPVYAIADGVISRLRVQIGGFGNAVYISHPNGYTSVYAHLQRFNPRIAATVKQCQYDEQSYDVDFSPQPEIIAVKKGEIIAWSGNTGGSTGPHLHFEIRDSKTEEIINPQLFGINIPDTGKPAIRGIYVYKLNGLPFSEKTPRQYFPASASGGKYHLSSPVITLNGETGLGIRASDQVGIYSIEIKADDKTIYSSAFERFYFDHTQAANSYIDYPALLNSGILIYKTFVEPGNPLRIYKNTVNNGLLNFRDDKTHEIEYTIKDVKGNTTTLAFTVKSSGTSSPAKEPAGTKKFSYNEENNFSTPDLKMTVPEGALYSDLYFLYSESTKPAGAYSPVHHIHTRLVPLDKPYSLSIKADPALPEDLRDKALIRDTRGKAYDSYFEEGYIKASPDRFGSFYITTDTTPPAIRPVNISDGKSMAGISKMTFKISDNLSGIKTFRGTIDGKWVLMEFDQKTATLWHTFDELTSAGKHTFRLDVTDKKLNTKTYTVNFYR